MKKGLFLGALIISAIAAGCSIAGAAKSTEDKVVILTNADEEAVEKMDTALEGAGYEGKYVLQPLGTSELGGKLLAEGKDIEADIVTMSSYFIESAQEQQNMFADWQGSFAALDDHPPFYRPLLANTGAIFVNTHVLEEKGLPVPKTIKDLTDPAFEGLVSIPNIMDSSTGWLLVQAIIAEYELEEGQRVLNQLIKNAGPHVESSGSGPIKKVQAGETAAGFGLRHQAVNAKQQGAPIDYVDPSEGNFSLIEGAAVIDKEDNLSELAMEMAEVLVTDARAELLADYPVALYEGETVSKEHLPTYSKKFSETLTVDLLKAHQAFFNASK